MNRRRPNVHVGREQQTDGDLECTRAVDRQTDRDLVRTWDGGQTDGNIVYVG